MDEEFYVFGTAMIPVEIMAPIMAPDAKTALARARRVLSRSKNRRRYIIPGTEDAASAHTFHFIEALPNHVPEL